MTLPDMPEGTFLHRYMRYMADQETPTTYDFMCGCWTLSVALGRTYYVARPKAPVRLNMYLILVSDSGVTRKSTSVRTATDLIRDYISNSNNHFILVESKITAGLLQYELYEATKKHGYSHVAISASELAAVLSRSSGISGMPALLTDLYDCPDTRIGGGNVSSLGKESSMKNVYTSFISASTPSWLVRAVTPAIIEGGFTSRCYFVIGDSRKRTVAWPKGDSNSDTRTELRTQLQRIAAGNKDANGRVDVSPSAISSFTEWYESRVFHKDDYRASFEAREDAHVLRFAGLLSVNDERYYINVDDIQNAINIVRQIKADGARLFSGTLLEKRDVRLIEKIRAILIAHGNTGISQTDILRNCRPTYKADQVNSVLSVMHELDLIQKFSVTGAGRPTTVWRATTYLANENLYADVAKKLGVID